MTADAIAAGTAGPPAGPPAALTVTADGAYGARLAPGRFGGWYAERWTLDGPEPYTVPLPASQPEEPAISEVAPLADGRVLIRRRAGERQMFSLLYPTGPETGELLLGAVECAELWLLPPAPGGSVAYALAPGKLSTSVWLVAGGSFGPELVAQVPGRCTGGVWLDRTGRMLALDQEPAGTGVTKAVAVDLERGGEVTPLLQIAEGSNDRLLLADPDSGLLLIRSDAPGADRLGWGVLGSMLPVRFPECLSPDGPAVTPLTVQPGQQLLPERCAVALGVGGGVAVWRPVERQLAPLTAPHGWLPGAGVWSATGLLGLPYATEQAPCGTAWLELPPVHEGAGPAAESGDPGDGAESVPPDTPSGPEPGSGAAGALPPIRRPIPLQQAPLAGRVAVGH